MTTKKTDTKTQGAAPSHSLYVKSNQFGDPVNIRIAAMWNNPDKGYMGVSMENLSLKENPNKGDGQPPYLMFVNTKIYGQDAFVEIGTITEREDQTGFDINLGDVVAFENKPRKAVPNNKKAANKNLQP